MAEYVANRENQEVALPQAGEGAFLRFTIEALEKLESKYGEDYLDVVMKGMTKARVDIFRTSVTVAANGMTTDHLAKFPWGKPLESFQPLILDGLYLSITGRTFEEQEKHEDDVYAKRLEEAKENPRLAAALFYQQLAAERTEPTSTPSAPAA